MVMMMFPSLLTLLVTIEESLLLEIKEVQSIAAIKLLLIQETYLIHDSRQGLKRSRGV